MVTKGLNQNGGTIVEIPPPQLFNERYYKYTGNILTNQIILTVKWGDP